MSNYSIHCVSDHPQRMDIAIQYFSHAWGSHAIYQNSIHHSLSSNTTLPNWYIMMDGDRIIGCVALILNDFISRQDIYPWLAALYVEPDTRGQGLSRLLIEHVQSECNRMGFHHLYLATDHIGYYEKFDFHYIGDGYHPWNESSRIYQWDIPNT